MSELASEAMSTSLRLTKHHGLGNDFLVVLDQPADAALAEMLCARHTGIGADGLIRGGADLTMVLWNADGSRAEMSGNGIRCLAQALVDAGRAPEGEVRIRTDAGEKVVWVEPETAPGLRQVRVDMGPANELPSGLISIGNPHKVTVADDLDALPDLGVPDVNREFIVVGPEPDAITMRVWERGVGETQACGTGACAAALVAHETGLVGSTVVVHQAGGDALVELKPDTIFLTGPSQLIARIEVPATA